MQQTHLFILFGVVIIGLLALDLGVFHRKSKTDSFRTSLLWTGFWISLALGFSGLIYMQMGKEPAQTFLTAWLVEQSLSVDNLFVFILILSAFKVPSAYQHRVLFWGIIGALVMRPSASLPELRHLSASRG